MAGRQESRARGIYRRTELPYGLWTCADGREVLFNRHYQPIYERLNRGKAMPSNRGEWVTFAHQQWFYTDSSARRRSTIPRLECIVEAFQSGREMREWLLS